MLIGKYYYKLQANNRVSLPKVFRQKETNWVATRGLDGCLFIYKTESFSQEIASLTSRSFTKKANRDLVRIMTNEAKEVEVDSNGRVRLPEYLIKFAQLNQNIVIVGSFNRVEIWDQDLYHLYADKLEKEAELIAEKIDT